MDIKGRHGVVFRHWDVAGKIFKIKGVFNVVEAFIKLGISN